jgi:hypothetical protein
VENMGRSRGVARDGERRVEFARSADLSTRKEAYRAVSRWLSTGLSTTWRGCGIDDVVFRRALSSMLRTRRRTMMQVGSAAVRRREDTVPEWIRRSVGAEAQIRTGDTGLFRAVLYRLSYLGTLAGTTGFEPAISGVTIQRPGPD